VSSPSEGIETKTTTRGEGGERILYFDSRRNRHQGGVSISKKYNCQKIPAPYRAALKRRQKRQEERGKGNENRERSPLASNREKKTS